ncbi:hypothetical protein [Mycobacterium lepromatosis]|nr:hypothetical protein [Mycobacterium lepromatosis]
MALVAPKPVGGRAHLAGDEVPEVEQVLAPERLAIYARLIIKLNSSICS